MFKLKSRPVILLTSCNEQFKPSSATEE